MDRDAKMDPELITQLFEMGLMGVEIPAQLSVIGFDDSCWM